MESKSDKLSSSARIVLNYISEGHSYEQILHIHPNLTFKDIFAAAQEALDMDKKIEAILTKHPSYQDRMEEIRKKHPNAYNPWEEEEEKTLRQMFKDGAPTRAIASALKRQPGAIRSRIRKLELIE